MTPRTTSERTCECGHAMHRGKPCDVCRCDPSRPTERRKGERRVRAGGTWMGRVSRDAKNPGRSGSDRRASPPAPQEGETHCCIRHPHEGPCWNWDVLFNEVTGMSLYDNANDLSLPLGHLTVEEAEAVRVALNMMDPEYAAFHTQPSAPEERGGGAGAGEGPGVVLGIGTGVADSVTSICAACKEPMSLFDHGWREREGDLRIAICRTCEANGTPLAPPLSPTASTPVPAAASGGETEERIAAEFDEEIRHQEYRASESEFEEKFKHQYAAGLMKEYRRRILAALRTSPREPVAWGLRFKDTPTVFISAHATRDLAEIEAARADHRFNSKTETFPLYAGPAPRERGGRIEGCVSEIHPTDGGRHFVFQENRRAEWHQLPATLILHGPHESNRERDE